MMFAGAAEGSTPVGHTAAGPPICAGAQVAAIAADASAPFCAQPAQEIKESRRRGVFVQPGVVSCNQQDAHVLNYHFHIRTYAYAHIV